MLLRVLVFVFSFASSVAFAHGPSDKTSMENLIAEILGTDIPTANVAVPNSTKYPYSEMTKALFEALQRTDIAAAYGKGSPTAFYLRFVLEALDVIGNNDELKHLRAARTNFERLVKAAGEKSELVAIWTRVENHMQGRLEPTRSIDGPSTGTLARPARGSSLTPAVPRKTADDTAAQTSTPAAPTVPLASADDENALPKFTKELYEGATEADILHLLENLDRNLYDELVQRLHDKLALPKIPYREHEIDFMLQTLRRTVKNHLLIIGKQGVGKTVMLRKLQAGWLDGTIPYPGDKVPLILELSITSVTNPNDPSALKRLIAGAKLLAAKSKRHVVLFLDEARVMTPLSRTAVKSFLSEENGNVHFVINTTSREVRHFKEDPAFVRRWMQLFVDEFTPEQAVASIKAAKLEDWRETHKSGAAGFSDISEDAFRFAVKYSPLEQPNAGQPTGLKELLEGTIVHRLSNLEKMDREGVKLSDEEHEFVIEPEDVRAYLKWISGQRLFPGDPNFDDIFQEIWTALKAEYRGNEALLAGLKSKLKSHLQSFDREMTLALANFGPPGAGKSYLGKMLSKHFFRDAILPINAGMFGEGENPLNVLIGSPTGYAGSEEQRSILTKFMQDHPWGGIILLEEADFLPQKVLDFLAESISGKGFYDGLGEWWSLDNYLIVMNSNMGQELLLPEGRTNWREYEARKSNLTQHRIIDGQPYEAIRPEWLEKIFDDFKMKVAKGRQGREVDGAQVRQNAMKLNRRFKPLYTFLPTREDLLDVAKLQRDQFVTTKRQDYGVNFDISDDVLEAIVDLDHYEFDKGHSYVNARLETYLTGPLASLVRHKGKTFTLAREDATYTVGRRKLQGHRIKATADDVEPVSWDLELLADSDNQWAANESMRKRVREFPVEMHKLVRNQDRQIEFLHKRLKAKFSNWDLPLNISQIGADGTGRSWLASAIAQVVYGSREAVVELPLKNTWQELQNDFRSPTGFVGNHEETAFERDLMKLKNAGGGVILLRGYLNFNGLDQHALAERMTIFNKLEPLIARRKVNFGSRPEDLRAFTVVITGNAGAEMFQSFGDGPEEESVIRRMLESVDDADITDYFKSLGFSGSMIDNFSPIFLNSPLPRAMMKKIAHARVDEGLRRIAENQSAFADFEAKVDPSLTEGIVDRVANVSLGMKKVNKALNQVLLEPIENIVFDIDGADRIEAVKEKDVIRWRADDKSIVPVALRHHDGDRDAGATWTFESEADPAHVRLAPQIEDLQAAKQIQVTPENALLTVKHEMGHWLLRYHLFGRSDVLSISAIASGRSLGRVSMMPVKEHDVTGLSFLLREMALLAAGAQAQIRSGIYATGAGHVPSKKDEERQDDYGKIERFVKTIINNGILDGLGENTPERRTEVPRAFLRELANRLAWEVLEYADSHQQFQPLYEQFAATKFLDEAAIQKCLSQIDSARITPPDLLFLQTLERALVKTHRAVEDQADYQAAGRLGQLAIEIFIKAASDTKTLNAQRAARDQTVKPLEPTDVEALEQKVRKHFGCEAPLETP